MNSVPPQAWHDLSQWWVGELIVFEYSLFIAHVFKFEFGRHPALQIVRAYCIRNSTTSWSWTFASRLLVLVLICLRGSDVKEVRSSASIDMQADTDTIYRWVEWLEVGNDEEQYQAALALRALAGDAGNKHLIREAGGIEALLRLLDSGNDSTLTVVGAETLSCLAADDPANRVSLSCRRWQLKQARTKMG